MSASPCRSQYLGLSPQAADHIVQRKMPYSLHGFAQPFSPLPAPLDPYATTPRLVHALLLGHVRSLPTLEDLRLMHNAFSQKASTASRASTIGEALKRGSTPENTAIPIQVPTLRIAQRHLPGVPWWFEQQGNEAGRGTVHAGVDSCSSTIRAVYAEAWGGDDGRVDGMDLLLTLCAVPDERAVDAVALEEDEGEDRDSGEQLRYLEFDET